jgi:hypothetical protein
MISPLVLWVMRISRVEVDRIDHVLITHFKDGAARAINAGWSEIGTHRLAAGKQVGSNPPVEDERT